jgi:hypothetical protein
MYKKTYRMKINTELLDLVTLYNDHKLGEVLKLYDLFSEHIFDMEMRLNLLKEGCVFYNLNKDAEEKFISSQLLYAKENLKTIEKTILCHEYDVFDAIRIRDDVFEICLN